MRASLALIFAFTLLAACKEKSNQAPGDEKVAVIPEKFGGCYAGVKQDPVVDVNEGELTITTEKEGIELDCTPQKVSESGDTVAIDCANGKSANLSKKDGGLVITAGSLRQVALSLSNSDDLCGI